MQETSHVKNSFRQCLPRCGWVGVALIWCDDRMDCRQTSWTVKDSGCVQREWQCGEGWDEAGV